MDVPEAGTLYVVSTPIGNLEDITMRAVRVLKEVGIIAAEDTRHTKQLCTHLGITTPLTSYHDFNKEQKTAVLLERLRLGTDVALVSDAGTPVISDPGYFLITRSIEAGIRVVPIPGPSAVLAALAASGLPSDSFRFEGFLPRRDGPRSKRIESFREDPSSLILFESPHRIGKLLCAYFFLAERIPKNIVGVNPFFKCSEPRIMDEGGKIGLPDVSEHLNSS